MQAKHFFPAVLAGLVLATVLLAPGGYVGPELLELLPYTGLALVTLAANKPRAFELGDRNNVPVIAADIIYEGAAVGIVAGTGHARPLVGGDKFAGFAEFKADNSAGAAAAINVQTVKSGQIQLSVAGAVITDVDQPVFASDDDTFVFSPVGGSFVGYVKRFVSSGVVVVAFDAGNYEDPFAEFTVREAISANKTLDSEDSGKLFWVDTDAAVITLPAVATHALAKIVNGGAFGAVAVTISPQALDSIEGPDITAADDKDIINTKATARRGDFATLGDADANGYVVTELRGIWARQA